jgi:hypothetical protein
MVGVASWLKPPRDVIYKIEALLEEGRSDTAIKNHHSLIDLDLTEQQVWAYKVCSPFFVRKV